MDTAKLTHESFIYELNAQLPHASSSQQHQLIVPGQTTYLTAGTVGFCIIAEGVDYYTFPRGYTVGRSFDMMLTSCGDDERN